MRVTQVSVTGVAASAPLPLDPTTVGGVFGIYVDPGVGCTITVEITPDNVYGSGPIVWYPTGIAALTALIADVASSVPFGVFAIRMNQTAGAATSTMKIVSQGIV